MVSEVSVYMIGRLYCFVVVVKHNIVVQRQRRTFSQLTLTGEKRVTKEETPDKDYIRGQAPENYIFWLGTTFWFCSLQIISSNFEPTINVVRIFIIQSLPQKPTSECSCIGNQVINTWVFWRVHTNSKWELQKARDG